MDQLAVHLAGLFGGEQVAGLAQIRQRPPHPGQGQAGAIGDKVTAKPAELAGLLVQDAKPVLAIVVVSQDHGQHGHHGLPALGSHLAATVAQVAQILEQGQRPVVEAPDTFYQGVDFLGPLGAVEVGFAWVVVATVAGHAFLVLVYLHPCTDRSTIQGANSELRSAILRGGLFRFWCRVI